MGKKQYKTSSDILKPQIVTEAYSDHGTWSSKIQRKQNASPFPQEQIR